MSDTCGTLLQSFYIFVSFLFFSTPSCTDEHVQNGADECGVVALVCLWSKACTCILWDSRPHIWARERLRSLVSSQEAGFHLQQEELYGVVILEPSGCFCWTMLYELATTIEFHYPQVQKLHFGIRGKTGCWVWAAGVGKWRHDTVIRGGHNVIMTLEVTPIIVYSRGDNIYIYILYVHTSLWRCQDNPMCLKAFFPVTCNPQGPSTCSSSESLWSSWPTRFQAALQNAQSR